MTSWASCASIAPGYVEPNDYLLSPSVGVRMRFSLRQIARTVAVVACAAGLAGPMKPAAAAPASGTPVTVGVILSITGPYAPLGEPERNAFVLAEKEINEHGGVNGRPIKFLIENDEGKADTAAQLATSLIGQNVALIIGGSFPPTF